MHAEERQLITDLFERMRSFGAIQKDHEAEQLIISLARQNPDAGYMLVQSVLVQEQTMAAQQQQVEAMQARIQQLEQQLTRGAPAPQAAPQSGGFLGGIFGGGRPAAQPAQRAGSVPAFGGQQQAAPSSSPWGRSAGAQPMQPQAQAPQAAAGGGFMRSAMATAAGVAGGMLAANAISGMLKGNNPTNTGAETASNTNNDPAYDQSYNQAAAEPSYQDPASNDPGYTDTGTDNSWDGGGDVEL